MVYDMAFPISGDVESNSEVQIKEMPKHTVISAIHKGKYTNLADTYIIIWNSIQENNYEPKGVPKEIYLNNPEDVSSEELLAEIQFPIK